jgi:hypothetical protein
MRQSDSASSASLDTDQAVVPLSEIDNGGHALGACGFGFIKPALNRRHTRVALKQSVRCYSSRT